MEIEVGEYVRINGGKILKFYKFGTLRVGGRNPIYYKTIITSNRGHYKYDKIIKHSKNIIDLIEVGDYVNGCEVMNIYKPKDIWEAIEVEINSKCTRCFLEHEIKSIVTKEQFNSVKYEVE